jgi:IS30 family transposase
MVPIGQSIDDRSDAANERSQGGQWKHDIICDCKRLLIFTDRKYRVEIMAAMMRWWLPLTLLSVH